MSIFTKISNKLKSLFSKECSDDNQEHYDTATFEMNVIIDNNKCEEKEELVEDTNINGMEEEQVKEEIIEEENIIEENPVKVCMPFSFEDVDKILNIVRPIIKSINTDESYINACKLVSKDIKLLKTYSSLSEDKMELIISLTQSKMFNEKISNYVNEYVMPLFSEKINNENIGEYTTTSKNGSIIIRKVG